MRLVENDRCPADEPIGRQVRVGRSDSRRARPTRGACRLGGKRKPLWPMQVEQALVCPILSASARLSFLPLSNVTESWLGTPTFGRVRGHWGSWGRKAPSGVGTNPR